MDLALEQSTFDMQAAEAFAGRMGDILNAGAVAVMVSIGHRLGLFDAMAALPPSTSTAIAQRAGLAERYVREWLAVMVTGGIATYDPARKAYGLPAEHAACLTQGAPLGNLAVYAQTVALIGQMQERLLSCFRTGEGLAYGDYPCFHQVMAEDSAQTVVARLFDAILPLADGLCERLDKGIDVLDAGCGRGLALIEMARRYPKSRFIGYDLCADAIAFASEAAGKAGLTNIRFERRDLTGYDEKQCFDLITSFDAVHDQKDPQALVLSLRAALKPGGVYLMQDIGGSAHLENNANFPMAALLYAISCSHCMPVSLGQGGLGLGTMWGWETAQDMLKAAGFRLIERHILPHDPMNVWFVARA
ncbi:class I SAM-dependent methyltransferase [Rhodoligotrophos defluvii]|uniref:class I SAM-dependent methyltransferase n=1 Tax=Rhodoligotrophos defluvii TaxID=2561934 RepID=UPI0010CA046C|nr:class I SAM-dependent methyltransferase [Rhodoligotrophos defluvii]